MEKNVLFSFSALKNKALDDLKGNWFYGVILCILVAIITTVSYKLVGFADSTISSRLALVLVNVGIFAITCPMTLGISYVFLNVSNGNDLKPTELFAPYSKKLFLPSVFTLSMKMVYVTLWMMLFIPLGFVKSISYSQTHYILIENPTLNPNEAITKSRKMMDGFKWTYFKLWISFIGWFVLSIFTLFIGLLWLVPYAQTTLANFHKDLKQHHESAGTFNQ